jgi:TetR/AcrR family transcriptional regulator, regulator of autoinduction and epiphytic fitness
MRVMSRLSFREQMLRAREDAIIESVNRLLAEKGFDLMTVDEVAADVGIAKASLYKHFTSKEELAAAAMVRVLQRAQAAIDEIDRRPALDPLSRLKEVARWTMRVQLAGQMPSLPAQNSSLRTALAANRPYMDGVITVSERLGAWITAAQANGSLDARLPAEAALYTLFARACDPVLGMLKASGAHSDDAIVEMLVSTCFDGLRGASAHHEHGQVAVAEHLGDHRAEHEVGQARVAV